MRNFLIGVAIILLIVFASYLNRAPQSKAEYDQCFQEQMDDRVQCFKDYLIHKELSRYNKCSKFVDAKILLLCR